MNMTLVNKIAFNQLNAVVATSPVEVKNDAFNIKVISFVNEMHNFGFLVTKELYQYLSSLDEATSVEVCQKVLSLAKESVGAHVAMKAFYPNFPRQVMEASDAELFINAILHYWTLGAWSPEYVEEKRPDLKEENPKTEISLISMEDVKAYFFRILASKNSIPASLVEFVEMGIEEGWAAEYKGEIPFKETLCRVATALVKQGQSINGVVATTTDVLRVMAALSESDIELKTKVRFKSLNRKARRALVSALEEVINISDVKAYASLWKRAFHSLHVGEFGGKVAEIAARFRNEKNVVTSETVVAEAIKSGDVKVAVNKLVNKPSVFARSLDKLLRDSDPQTSAWVIKEFAKVVEKVDSKVLLQVLGHFKGRSLNEAGERVVFTAGSKGKALLAPSLKALDKSVVEHIVSVIKAELKNKFAEKALLKGKKVFISPEVYSVLIPSQLASITENKKTVARGSRVPLDLIPEDAEKNVLRMFIHWIGQDQDLSAFFINEDMTEFSQVAYYNLRNSYACHSGDVTYAPAPHGGSEFLDVRMDEALADGMRYIAMDVRVYNGPTFLKHERSFAGFMLRNDLKSGEIFEPTTVRGKFDITLDGSTVMPCFFDMKTREMIWLDSVLPGCGEYSYSRQANNLNNNIASSTDMLRAYLKMKDTKVTMKELVCLHIDAVGATQVFDKEEADYVVGLGEGDLDVYDFVEINADWI
ncbi:TPA: hypothetical protein ACPYXD_005306, partial [Enterobacter hormaechei subsp. xiangfangensis]